MNNPRFVQYVDSFQNLTEEIFYIF